MHNSSGKSDISKNIPAEAGADILLAQLGPTHRALIERHLRSLPATDRRLRFGYAIRDESIAHYVRHMRFYRDAAFGAFDSAGALIGFGHLSNHEHGAEFALSVDPATRGRGIGRALLKRAAAHARNQGHRVLVMQYLPENHALAALARRSGMQAVCDSSECRAYIGLKPPTPHSLLREAWREAVAAIDLGFRRSAAGATSA